MPRPLMQHGHGNALCLLGALVLLGGCAKSRMQAPPPRPAEVRAQIVRLLPAGTTDRAGWATDIQVAFTALAIDPTTQNLCAALAVAQQESSFEANPTVPGLGRIARAEIDRRAAQHRLPAWLVDAALMLKSPDGRRYRDRIAMVRSERELSLVYEDFIAMVPLGQRLFGDDNPIHTGGPMQVSVAFAQQYAQDHPYPYPVDESIRHEVFTRRGGMYFGIAHLLGYPADYRQPLYRYADFNAGWYASRNAAFQNAVSLASGIALVLDGDLVRHRAGPDGSAASATERAVRTLAARLDISDAGIRRALKQGDSKAFEATSLYQRVFALAERMERRPLPRALMPRIALESPKITRKLTTEWFAKRVDQRYRRCLAKAPSRR